MKQHEKGLCPGCKQYHQQHKTIKELMQENSRLCNVLDQVRNGLRILGETDPAETCLHGIGYDDFCDDCGETQGGEV
jgi:hypothetical protein